MLSDAQIERWSRQILLPEVGGRGQSRLLAARVGLIGGDAVADGAVDLLGRAGVTIAPGAVPDGATLLVDLAGETPEGATTARGALSLGVPLVRGRLAGAAGSVHTLIGRPCGLCVAARPPGQAHARALVAPAAQALAALIAAETLGVLLAPPRRGRVQRFDLTTGDFGGGPLDDAGCDLCGGRA